MGGEKRGATRGNTGQQGEWHRSSSKRGTVPAKQNMVETSVRLARVTFANKRKMQRKANCGQKMLDLIFRSQENHYRLHSKLDNLTVLTMHAGGQLLDTGTVHENCSEHDVLNDVLKDISFTPHRYWQ